MKKFAAILLCFVICLNIHGQADSRVTLKPYVGLCLYQFVGDEADGCTMRPGVMCGMELRYQLLDFMSLSGGLEYVPRGSNIKPLHGYLRQDQLSIPILLQFHPFGQHLTMTLGAAPSFTVHRAMKESGQAIDSKDLFYDNDVVIPLGVTYRFSNGLCLGARLSAGRKTMVRRDAIYHDVHYNLRGASVTNNEVTITVGYQMKL